jgi:hypothetical protein
MNCFVVRRFAFAVSYFLAFVLLVSAQEKKSPYQLQVRTEQESAIYKKGENVVFQVRLLENEKPLAGKELSYLVQGDGSYEKKGTIVSTDSVAVIEASLNRPGFLKCSVQ